MKDKSSKHPWTRRMKEKKMISIADVILEPSFRVHGRKEKKGKVGRRRKKQSS